MKKAKRKEYKIEGVKVQFVPYSDVDEIGYIRFEKDGCYLFSIDKRNKWLLKHLHKTIGEWIP